MTPPDKSITVFQSTPPGWEATSSAESGCPLGGLFQSTPPGWEATRRNLRAGNNKTISIHASRVGGDTATREARRRIAHFNPRLPGGRRPLALDGRR